MPNMLGSRPACNPVLNVLVYVIEAKVARWVDGVVREDNIATEVGPEIAVRAVVQKPAAALPLAQRCVMDVRRRAQARIDAGGGYFGHQDQKRTGASVGKVEVALRADIQYDAAEGGRR